MVYRGGGGGANFKADIRSSLLLNYNAWVVAVRKHFYTDLLLGNIVVLLLLFFFFELAMHHFQLLKLYLPETLAGAIREYYENYRNTIQFDPNCAVFHPDLSYTLRPGTCIFENREFRHAVRVNSMGYRASEAALYSPDLIFLGDSATMGWGVSEQARFSDIVADKLGVKVLNAAVSSYGTARALLGASRLDLSSVDTVIIQYCSNDDLENREFVLWGGSLARASPFLYSELSERIRAAAGYYPGRHTMELFPLLVSRLLSGGQGRAGGLSASDGREAEYFLRTLEYFEPQLLGKRIIIMEIGQYFGEQSPFMPSLREHLKEQRGCEICQNMELLDLSKVLSRSSYFLIDDHIDEVGHRQVAMELVKALGEPSIREGN